MIENYFGPSGKLAKTSNALDRILKFKNELQSRFKRDVSPTVDTNEIQENTAMKERFGTNGFGDFYIRHLDTTVFSSSFTQDELSEYFLSRSFFAIFDKLMEGAKDHNIELTEPFTFLDDEFVIPTVSGLPLNLELEGTTVLSLQLNGKVDIKALLKGNMDSDVRTRILPSAATTIRAKMSVGAGPVESGLQIEGKIHTASGIDIAMTRQAGKFELKVNLPEDKVQVLSIRSELFWVEAQQLIMNETPLHSKFASKLGSNPFCTLSSVLSLRLCAEVQIPQYADPNSPSFPFVGNSVLGISIEKIEPSMQGYYFKVENSEQGRNKKFRASKNILTKLISLILTGGIEKKFLVLFDTPGSTKNRKVTAEGRYSMTNSPKFELDVNTPSTNLKLECKFKSLVNVNLIDLNKLFLC